jgi:hypothetical protein
MAKEIIADKTDAATAAMLKRKPSGKKTYKPHVSTKIKWAMGDAMENSREAQRRMKRILDRMEEARAIAEVSADAPMLAVLGKLDHEIAILALGVADIERGLAKALAECKPEKKNYSQSSQ